MRGGEVGGETTCNMHSSRCVRYEERYEVCVGQVSGNSGKKTEVGRGVGRERGDKSAIVQSFLGGL